MLCAVRLPRLRAATMSLPIATLLPPKLPKLRLGRATALETELLRADFECALHAAGRVAQSHGVVHCDGCVCVFSGDAPNDALRGLEQGLRPLIRIGLPLCVRFAPGMVVYS